MQWGLGSMSVRYEDPTIAWDEEKRQQKSSSENPILGVYTS